MQHDWIALFLKKKYLMNKYLSRIGRRLNLVNPKTFNEKIQWLKLYWHNDLAEKCADKYSVREYVREKGLGETLNELIGVYESVYEIKPTELPEQFVLKATHGSGWNIICRDKASLDWDSAFKQMEKWMRKNYYFSSLEWVYKNIKKRIICERYLAGEDGDPPIDYKILCFNGEPKCLFLCTDRFSDTGLKVDFYDLDWNKLPFCRFYPNSDYIAERPEKLDEMIEISRRLAEGFPFVRIDLFAVKDKIFFGEMTFFPGSGLEPFEPEEYDYVLGQWLELPERYGDLH